MARVRLLSVFFILGIFVLSAFIPLRWVEGVPLCFFHSVTGFNCPGCGLTRAFISLFHGNFVQTIHFNAMAPVLVLWLLIYLADHLHTFFFRFRPSWFTPHGGRWITRTFLFLLVGQWMASFLDRLK